MALQLTIFSLALLALFLIWHLSVLLAPQRRRGFAAGAGQGAPALTMDMEALFRDALWSYVPFAAIALLMFASGKPDVLPQWAGWAVVGLQVPRSIAVYLERPRIRSFFGLLALICLIYLWVMQLPFLTPLPA